MDWAKLNCNNDKGSFSNFIRIEAKLWLLFQAHLKGLCSRLFGNQIHFHEQKWNEEIRRSKYLNLSNLLSHPKTVYFVSVHITSHRQVHKKKKLSIDKISAFTNKDDQAKDIENEAKEKMPCRGEKLPPPYECFNTYHQELTWS